MIEIADLWIDVTLALKKFDLRFDGKLDKRVTGIFGPSGCGKTSLVETIVGLRENAAGTIRYCETTWQDSKKSIFVPPELRGIGYVPQNGLLFPHLSVRQNLMFGAKRATGGDKIFEQVVDMLELIELLDRMPGSLSGGERQRVAVGRAVCSGPQMLILDEPLASLDTSLRYKTLQFFARLVNELNVKMIWVSHDAIELQAICDEVIAIGRGAIIKRGIPIDVFTSRELFSNFEISGFQNVVRGRIEHTDDSETVVMFSDRKTKLAVTHKDSLGPPKAGEDATVSIPARSILVALENPIETSARNVLQGKICRLETQSKQVVMAHVRISNHPGSSPLIAELTSTAAKRLNLKTGRSVFLLIKSTACTLQTLGNHNPTWSIL